MTEETDVKEDIESDRQIPITDSTGNSLSATEQRLNDLARQNEEYRGRLEQLEKEISSRAAAAANTPTDPIQSVSEEFDRFCEEHYGN